MSKGSLNPEHAEILRRPIWQEQHNKRGDELIYLSCKLACHAFKSTDGGMNVELVCITGPPAQSFDKVIRLTTRSRQSGCVNAEAMASKVARDSS